MRGTGVSHGINGKFRSKTRQGCLQSLTNDARAPISTRFSAFRDIFFMTKTFLDDDTPFTHELLRSTVVAANLPDIQTARTLLAAYEPRNAIEAMLAAQLVAQQAALIETARSAAEPGLSVEELLRRTDAVIRLDKTIRSAQRSLGRKPGYPALASAAAPPVAPIVPIDERLKAHFVDGGTSVH